MALSAEVLALISLSNDALLLFTIVDKEDICPESALSAFARVVDSDDIAEVFPFTALVKVVICADIALSALIRAAASVLTLAAMVENLLSLLSAQPVPFQ